MLKSYVTVAAKEEVASVRNESMRYIVPANWRNYTKIEKIQIGNLRAQGSINSVKSLESLGKAKHATFAVS